ncbi:MULTISPECIES: tail fiber protein [unclassified Sphingobium]|uniref:tail fiber protein n=1 Tax=unclassified Sphingobium TaxID=2611147 RepID=UPI0022254FB0|nr:MULTISPECIES: tail fiber protein [unclassified Sphingobium]MCW2396168.1 hypothetical protein [Sphingobium sp. B8D3B]MCW2419684.1 hypothetical protein [Sphingobium sp. B8D3C]
MALSIIVTDAGRAALVNAENNGTSPVVITQAGITATAVVPSPGATAVPGEIKRISTISGDVVANDMIHLVVRDETADSYALRSFGLYLADGTLFAVYGQAEPVMEKSSQAMMLLAIDIAFADIDAAQISFGDANFINPPATETVRGVVELATPAETAAGVDTTRAVHPKGLKDSVTSWLNARFGEGNPSAFMKGLLATASAAAMRVALGIKSGALKDEGAGGGLDADLLDGQQGSYYSNVTARLGYTPANKAGETFTGPISVPSINVASGDLYLSRTSDSWGYVIRPSAAGYRNLGFTTEGGVAPLDNVNFHALYVGRQGHRIWDAGNDGAGSGLDADLLRGLSPDQVVTVSRILAALGFTPANRGGDTFSGTITAPAFKLDGLYGASASGMSVGTGDGASFTTFNMEVKSWYGIGFRTYDNSVNGVYDSRAGLWNVRAGYYINGTSVWHPGNDGAGSGLDADLLDGHQADAFDRITAQNLSANDGYIVHANGLKECWTTLFVPGDSGATWALPVGHSQWVNPVISMSIQNGENNAQQVVGIVSASLTHIQIYSAVNYGQTVRIQTKGV